MVKMDDWHLGYSSRGSRGLTLGTQHRYFQSGIKRAGLTDDGEKADTQEAPESKKPRHEEQPDDGQGQEAPGKDEGTEGGNGDSTGGTAPALDQEGADQQRDKRDETPASGDTEQQQSPPKQEDKQSSEAGEAECKDGAAGTDGGLCSTDREHGTEGSDGPPAADGERKEQ